MKTLPIFGIVAAATLLITLPPLPSLAQQDHAHGTTTKSAQGKSMMTQRCAMMMKSRQGVEATTKAQDAKLKKLTAVMNQASETQKSAAMAAVIYELVTQRTARQEMMKQQQSQMMAHMREHMQAGGKMSMMQCPMMSSGSDSPSKGMMGHNTMKMK